MRDYRKLEAFQCAHELTLLVYGLTKKFPPEERYGLASQLRRACSSIGSNIAEGSARKSETEYLRFFEIAHSSSWEVEYQLTLAKDLGYFAENHMDAERAVPLCRKVSTKLARLLQSFEK